MRQSLGYSCDYVCDYFGGVDSAGTAMLAVSSLILVGRSRAQVLAFSAGLGASESVRCTM